MRCIHWVLRLNISAHLQDLQVQLEVDPQDLAANLSRSPSLAFQCKKLCYVISERARKTELLTVATTSKIRSTE